jgi:hypothetical protein
VHQTGPGDQVAQRRKTNAVPDCPKIVGDQA